MATRHARTMPGAMPDRASAHARDPRARRSARALLDALLELLEERPLEGISAGDIAARAGVGRATFFRHFYNKEALLEQLATDQIETLVALTLPIYDTAETPTAFRALCAYVDEHRPVWTVLLAGGAAAMMRAALLRASLRSAAGRTQVEGWLPVDLAVACTTSVIIEGLTWWLTRPAGTVDRDQAADIIYRLVLQPRPPAEITPAS